MSVFLFDCFFVLFYKFKAAKQVLFKLRVTFSKLVNQEPSTGCDRSTSEGNEITILAITWNKIVANHRVKEAREHR